MKKNRPASKVTRKRLAKKRRGIWRPKRKKKKAGA